MPSGIKTHHLKITHCVPDVVLSENLRALKSSCTEDAFCFNCQFDTIQNHLGRGGNDGLSPEGLPVGMAVLDSLLMEADLAGAGSTISWTRSRAVAQ